jgi:hypothetical protein
MWVPTENSQQASNIGLTAALEQGMVVSSLQYTHSYILIMGYLGNYLWGMCQAVVMSATWAGASKHIHENNP